MTSGGFRLGKILGIELRIDAGLFVIFVLVALSLGGELFPRQHPDWTPTRTWLLAFVAATCFFASIFLHEMSHALVARAFGISVESITLFLFGGLAHMKREPDSPKAELAIAAVGPFTSLAIGAGAIGIGRALAAGAEEAGALATLLLWLGPVNVVLGVFNLVPGFPLDGGRVLRAAIWAGTNDLRRATYWASKTGQAFGFLLTFVGIAMAFGFAFPWFGGGLVQGLWFAFIGWFLSNAAAASYRQAVVHELLDGATVARLMRTDAITVSPDLSVAELVDGYFLGSTDQRAFPVVAGDRLVGIVSLRDVRKVPRAAWPGTRVGDVMTREALPSAAPQESLAE
ncbi:MAG TPA: site-2 protease family protein, partial [Planctomycetota bacterium]|nr:site-2 protease family protein [Planctomycetota bacterium]